MDPKLQKLLDALGPAEQLSFMRIAEALYQTKFTGSTEIHWFNGVPKQLNLGAPVKLAIVEGFDKPSRGGTG